MKKLILFIIGIVSIMVTGQGCSHTKALAQDQQQEVVILVHGYGRSASAMWKLEQYFEQAGFQVRSVGYNSLIQGVPAIKKQLAKKLNKLLKHNTQKVHFVGHSMGGLLIRSYLGENQVNHLGNVVTMGSPNAGTPLADYFLSKWYGFLGGPALKSLSAKGSPFLKSLPRPDYNLGVIAGVVHRASREHLLPGKDDGLVPLQSTKVLGMKDFIVMPVSHYNMRYNQAVATQAIHFLQRGVFTL